MAIEVCEATCKMGCNVNLLRDPTILGDYFEGILHKWCPCCGMMYGPGDFDIKEISRRNAKQVAESVSRRFNLDTQNVREIALHCLPCFDVEIFAVNFSLMIGNKIGKRVPMSFVINETFRQQ